MAYFPMFVELEGETVLIIGGGQVAYQKAKRLEAYGAGFVVIAPYVLHEFDEIRDACILRREFEPRDLTKDYVFVIAATNDQALNRQVAERCRALGVPVNVVDVPEECSFLFPSLVQRGRLSVGISTGGASPTAAKYLKEQIGALVPEEMEELLDWLADTRGYVKERVLDELARKHVYEILFETCMGKRRPLTMDELDGLLDGA